MGLPVLNCLLCPAGLHWVGVPHKSPHDTSSDGLCQALPLRCPTQKRRAGSLREGITSSCCHTSIRVAFFSAWLPWGAVTKGLLSVQSHLQPTCRELSKLVCGHAGFQKLGSMQRQRIAQHLSLGVSWEKTEGLICTCAMEAKSVYQNGQAHPCIEPANPIRILGCRTHVGQLHERSVAAASHAAMTCRHASMH